MDTAELRKLIATETSEMHTSMPGVVVSYDGKSRATVRPALKKQLTSGVSLPAPIIVDVPVLWYQADIGGSRAIISLPLKAGDGVLLHFSERALEDWLNGGDTPSDPRKYDLTDAFALPACNAQAIDGDPENLLIQYGGGSMKITPAGGLIMNFPTIEITGACSWTGAFVQSGGGLSSNGVTLNSHTHSNVQAGSSNTGEPT